MSNLVPCLPDNAPFTPAQRAWLNGFLAGLFSQAPAAGPSAVLPPAPPKTLTVLFGSESGNSEALAKRTAKAATKRGWQAKVLGLDKISPGALAAEERVLILTSTYGDGEPPENAKAFHAALHEASQPRLEGLCFAVLALGDKNYEHFCKCGLELDARLAALGATRLYERVDCDVDFDAPYEGWLESVFTVLEAGSAPAPAGSASTAASPVLDSAPTGGGSTATIVAASPGVLVAPAPTEVAYSRKHPFPAPLLTNRLLSADGSAKEIRHFEFSLEGSGLTYEVGDALGVFPQNCPALVEGILRALNRDGEEAVTAPSGEECSLRQALERHYEITKIPTSLLTWVAAQTTNHELRALLAPDARAALSEYLYGREIIDLLEQHPLPQLSPAEFVGHLRKLNPRLYSISSSPKASPGEVHLTIGTVRYESLGRGRKGVCSTFLADRANGPVPVFVQPSHGFRLPAAADTPIIMVGPGTGIAPFRAFLHERRALGATGRNWLFFGDQRSSTDFIYREELEPMLADGHLTRLSTAFSRDQAEKVYVQTRMQERGAELWRWLQEGAHFYVCGDASRMAKDVDAALQQIATTHGGHTPESATAYLEDLRKAKRYQRDVY